MPADLPAVDVVTASGPTPLVDVREDAEWAAGHAPAARHLPLSDLLARLDELPTDGPVNIICRVGGRSAQAVAYLRQQGYDVRNVDGGMLAWEAAGLPVEVDGGAPGHVL